MAGNVLALSIRSTVTVGHVKSNIHRELGVPPPQQRLILVWKVVEDGRTLASYGVVISFVRPLRPSPLLSSHRLPLLHGLRREPLPPHQRRDALESVRLYWLFFSCYWT